MSLYIYQIGSIKLHAQGSSIEELVFETDRDWETQTNKPNLANKFLVYGQGIVVTFPKIKIKGSLICSNCKTVAQQYNELATMAGRAYIDVIAYLPAECCSMGCSCNKCNNCGGGTEPVWMTTTGVLRSMSRRVEFNADEPMSTEILPVELELTIDPFWYPMNRYLWEYVWNGQQSDSFRRLDTLEEGGLPPFVPKYGQDIVFRKKIYDDPLKLYDPSIWQSAYGTFEALGRNWREADNFAYRVAPSRGAWPAPPSSLYMFTNLPTSGEVVIEVESEISSFTTDTNTATLNLADLNTLLSPDSLSTTDVVVLTDGHRSPGFILRDGEILEISNEAVVPDWLYTTTYPAEMLGVDNKVHFTAPDGVQVAYLHVYRGY